jgi:hypothetical protein
VMSVELYTLGFARMAGRALPVTQWSCERCTVDISISLRVWIVTIDTAHATVHVAVTETLILLIRERAYPPIGKQRAVAEQRKGEGVISLQRIAGDEA